MLSMMLSIWRWLTDPSPNPRQVSEAWRREHGYGWRPERRD
jgi:hypothetical protein